MRVSIFLILSLLVSSCVSPIPRRPVSHHSYSILKESVERNKMINELEEQAIKYYIARDSMNVYLKSSNGYWYRYVHQNLENVSTPKIGDVVKYNHEISNLDNEVLYSFNDLGSVEYVIDKEDAELGIQSGLKLMKKGEDVVFVFPSFSALGLLGDKEKIGMNEPLVYRVQLLEIN